MTKYCFKLWLLSLAIAPFTFPFLNPDWALKEILSIVPGLILLALFFSIPSLLICLLVSRIFLQTIKVQSAQIIIVLLTMVLALISFSLSIGFSSSLPFSYLIAIFIAGLILIRSKDTSAKKASD